MNIILIAAAICLSLFVGVWAMDGLLKPFHVSDYPLPISLERMVRLEADAAAIRMYIEAIKALDTDPNAKVYTSAEVQRMIGLDGLKCKVQMQSNGAWYYGTIQGGEVNCGCLGGPIRAFKAFVFLEDPNHA